MTAETTRVAAPTRRSCRASAIGTSYEGREHVGGRRSPTTSATDEAEPEVLFTAGQHAREHLTIEMALYLLNELTSQLRDRPADHGTRRTRARSGSSRTSTRTAASTTSPPAATARGARTASPTPGSSAVGTDLNRNWGFQWGCCGGSSGTFSSETYRGPSAVLGARDPARARLRQQPRGRRRAADQGRDRLPHLLGAGPVAVRLHDAPTPRPALTADDQAARSRRSAASMAAHQRLHARAGQRPLHHRRHDRRLAVGPAQDLRLHVRDVPAHVEPRLLPARRGDRPRDEPQPRGRAAAAGGRRLPVPRDRQAVLQRRAAGLQRHFETATGWTTNAAAPRRPALGARDPAATTRAAPSSSARRRAASMTS